MNGKTFSLGQSITDGWNGIKEFPGPALLGFLVFFVIMLVLGVIPFVSIIAALVLDAAFIGGITILALNIQDRNNPQVGNVFEGFSKFGKFLGLYWLTGLIVLACAIPGGIIVAIGAGQESDTLLVIGSVVMLVIVIPIGIRLSMCYYLVADTALTVTDCIKKSFELTKGNSLKIFLWGLVAMGIIFVGTLCLFIGYFVAVPLVMIGWASIYRQLAGKK